VLRKIHPARKLQKQGALHEGFWPDGAGVFALNFLLPRVESRFPWEPDPRFAPALDLPFRSAFVLRVIVPFPRGVAG
jgi:hypothetical protein